MRRRSRASSFKATLKPTRQSPSSPPADDEIARPILLNALKNSMTHKDQILQRRIGVRVEPDTDSTESRRAGHTSSPEE